MSTHDCRMRAWTALLLCSLGMLGACVTIEGQSSGEQKQILTSSFLFHSADIFFPGGKAADGHAAWTNPQALRELDRNLNEYNENIRAMHRQNRALLARILATGIPADVHTRVDVLNTGKPLAQVDSHGVISIDATIARSLFRTAIVAGVHDESDLGGFRFMDQDVQRFGKHAETEQEAVEQFLQVKHDVETGKGQSMFGDLVDMLRDDDVDNSAWQQMTSFSGMSAVVERHYSGPILFMLAHETGHVALQHAQRRRTMRPGDCAGLQAMEDEADLYATLLLSLSLSKSGAMGLDGGDAFGFGTLTGFEDFFNITYEMAGFDASGSDAACTHPPVAERLASARATLSQVQDAVRDEFNLAVQKALATAQEGK